MANGVLSLFYAISVVVFMPYDGSLLYESCLSSTRLLHLDVASLGKFGGKPSLGCHVNVRRQEFLSSKVLRLVCSFSG